MCKLSANHTGKPLLRYLSNVQPGRNNAGINMFLENCIWLTLFIMMQTKPQAFRNMFTFSQSVSESYLKLSLVRV